MGAASSRYSENDYELVIKASKELEHLLEVEFQASGQGLHQKISSVQDKLPPNLVKRMRFLATIRNKLIHERGFDQIPNRTSFISAFEESVTDIENILKKNGKGYQQCIIC